MKYDIKSIELAEKGHLCIEWAANAMPVLKQICQRFTKNKPLEGLTIAACLHITSETAVLASTLKAGGAKVILCASNPLSTQDEVAASLVKDYNLPVFAIKNENSKTYYQHLNTVLEFSPQIIIDDGADLTSIIHSKYPSYLNKIIGGTEETTTGVIRLEAMTKDCTLAYPVIAVNNAKTKYLFDNRYGTGQSTIDGIIRATNRLLAGSNFVICGYGWCGRGVAMRAKGMGANVIITEIDPLRALEAIMDGFQVMTIAQAAIIGDFFCTLTGNINVIRQEHFLQMKNGAIIANSGHFNVELDLKNLYNISKNKRLIRNNVEEYLLINNKCIYLLGEGRLVNLAIAEGHPSNIMDMSFANQALCVAYIKANSNNLKKKVYSVPSDIDLEVANLKLASIGITIDLLTFEQKKYLLSWNQGTT